MRYVLTVACVLTTTIPLHAEIVHHLISGPDANARAGRAVCGLGDVDLDGHDDFALGCPSDAVGRTQGGSVRVFSGADGSELAVFGGPQNSRLGRSLAATGDVNGDGYPDLLAGAPLANGSRGLARIYSGRWMATRLGEPILATLEGASADDLFGWSVASGRVNADAVSDIVIGASGKRTAYVFDGATRQLIYSRFENVISFGTSVAVVDDLNQDGRGEVIIGANSDAAGGLDRGSIYVYSGLTGSLMAKVVGRDDEAFFGWSIASVLDVDGDSIGDVLVGAPGEPRGYARIYSGRLLGLGQAQILFHLEGEEINDGVGFSVCDAGDFDADGTMDFAIGSFPAATVRVFSGETLTVVDAFSLDLDFFGYSLDHTGDVDGDGVSDLVVGCPEADLAGIGSGGAVVFGGSPCPAHAANYGTGWAGTYGVPAFEALSDPSLGTVLSVRLEADPRRGTPVPSVLFAGIIQTELPTTWGGSLLLLPSFAISVVIPAGGVTLPMDIPDYEPFCGLSVFMQNLQLDAGASHGVAFTRGLRLALGE